MGRLCRVWDGPALSRVGYAAFVVCGMGRLCRVWDGPALSRVGWAGSVACAMGAVVAARLEVSEGEQPVSRPALLAPRQVKGVVHRPDLRKRNSYTYTRRRIRPSISC